MRELKVWLAGMAVLAMVAMPLRAENNEGVKANEATPSASDTGAGASASAANPTPMSSSAIRAVSVSGLLDALLKKGVMTPSEVNAIRVATPETELQLLVEALTRKGVLNAEDLPATSAATPAE